jgi:tRNA 2-thiouridine synthesizing protein E
MNEINLNEEGFMTDFSQWTKDVAISIAQKEEVVLEEKHWEVIQFLQEQHKNEIPLTIRRVGKSGVVSIKELYTLFPNAPLKTSTKIAGIPKPKSCI